MVCRAGDETVDTVRLPDATKITFVTVQGPGVLAAMAAGTSCATGEVVAYCDDDAVPRPDWVERIAAAFEDPTIGAFGGRDVLGPPHPVYPATETAGVLKPWGRLTGDHHRVVGPPRDVDVLKAVNMAFRRRLVRFPLGLRGKGAQVHFEVAMCLAAQRDGFRVRLDPNLVVDHHPDDRFDADRRDRPTWQAISDAAFNSTFGLLSLRPELTGGRAAFGLLVGDVGSPGLARAAFGLAQGERETLRRLLPSLNGQVAALVRLRRGASVRLVEPRGLVPAPET